MMSLRNSTVKTVRLRYRKCPKNYLTDLKRIGRSILKRSTFRKIRWMVGVHVKKTTSSMPNSVISVRISKKTKK